jgi:chromosome segregation ATPase
VSGILRSLTTMTSLTALLGAPTLFGQQAAPQPVAAEVPAQLVKLNQTLAEIADLLERNLEGQRLGLVMARIQLSSGRSARAEEQLATARATRTDLQNQKAKMEGQLQIFADRMDMGQVDMPAEEIEAMADESALQLDLLKRQIKAMDQEIVELENALKRYQRDLDDWQSLIDRRLSDY